MRFAADLLIWAKTLTAVNESPLNAFSRADCVTTVSAPNWRSFATIHSRHRELPSVPATRGPKASCASMNENAESASNVAPFWAATVSAGAVLPPLLLPACDVQANAAERAIIQEMTMSFIF